MNCNSIIPKPKIMLPGTTFLKSGKEFSCNDGFGSTIIACAVKTLADETGIKTLLEIKPVKSNISNSIDPEIEHEAYRLIIKENGIEIHAVNERGAFYGLKTLRQLLSRETAIQTIEITDWPDLKLRGFHITLGNGFMPSAEHIQKVIEQLGNFKLNALVIEYDDRFPWQQHKTVCHRNAYTVTELQSVLQTAKDNFIEVIPLLDSLGHASQYLKHKEYVHLKELPEHNEEMCASNPATLQFVKELWTEVLELHPDARYAHITGDEVFRQGGFCPECQKHADAGTLAKLFTQYYKELSEWIIAKGKIPIIWGDMLIKYPEDLANFPRNIVINDWWYSGEEGNLDSPCCKANPEGVCDEDRIKLFEHYWKQDDSGKYHPYPFFKFFTDYGFKCLASTAASEGNGGRFPVSSFKFRFENHKTFAKTVLENNGMGVLSTYWNNNGPMAGGWLGIAACADFSWHVREEGFVEFMERFVDSFLGQSKEFAAKMIALDNCVYYDNESKIEITESAKNGVSPLVDDYMKLLKTTACVNLFDQKLKKLTETVYSATFTGESQPLNLSGAANSSAANCMPATAGAFRPPSGEKTYGGIKFFLPPPATEGYITVSKDKVQTPVIINEHYDAIAFCNNAYYAPAGTIVAETIITYSDGSSAKFDFISGVNTADWFGYPQAISDGIASWAGYTEETCRIAGYLNVWINPHPEKQIAKISFVPLSTAVRLIVYGISAIRMSAAGGTVKPVPVNEATILDLERQVETIKSSLKNIYAGIMPEDEAEAGVKLFEKFRLNSIDCLKNSANKG